MLYWTVAQIEPNRDHLASHTLHLAGYKIYQPLLREQRRLNGRKVAIATALFPTYLFVWVVSGWWNARWAAGVRRLIMDGEQPARVPGGVIDEIRARENADGFIELLPRQRGLRVGDRVRVVSGPFVGQLALFAGMRPHERVLILLALLGGEQRVELARGAIEAM